MSKKKTFIGIDVSKAFLEGAVHQQDTRFAVANKESTFPDLIAELVSLRPKRIVLEATGGLEIPVVSALYAAGLPVVVVNPTSDPRLCQSHRSVSQNGSVGCDGTSPLRRCHPTPVAPRKKRCGT